jgi:DNA-binding NarL/FixJ family response regulator
LETLRVIVAEDHPLFRKGVISLLEALPDFEVVGEASGGEEAVELARQMEPDVILLDLEMPGTDGIDALRRLREAGSAARTVIFTAYDTDERVLGALRAGARGYLLKGASREEIFAAVRTAASGGSPLEPSVTSRLLERANRDSPGPEDLTPREREVLKLLAEGLQNREIAARLFVTERTVKFHVSSILHKLGAHNRTEAVSIAARRGLVEIGD